MPPDLLEKLAEIMHAIAPELARKVAHLKNHVPDPIKNPVVYALHGAYLSRLEMQLSYIRRGKEGMIEEHRDHPNLLPEIQEFEAWVLRRKTTAKKQLTEEQAETLGNWLVSIGRSYSETKNSLRQIGSSIAGRGAPNKRSDTLKMLDAKIANSWSYRQLAEKMCDCGAEKHTEHCAERIRKRLKELGEFLQKYDIVYRPPEKK
jgi:hypothetical protein